jgi:hypothetical protein
MPVLIGGPRAWKVRRHGDIGVSFQWVNGDPAMILFPANKALPGAGAYVIPIDSAHKYADSKTGAPTPWLARQCITAARQLGFMETDRFAARRIADVIVDSLPDLIDMPPEPQSFNEQQAAAIGEMSIKLDGKTIAERDVTAPTAEEFAA